MQKNTFDTRHIALAGYYTNTGTEKRKHRQLLREFAVANRRDYGRYSIKTYLAYYPLYQWSS